MADSPEMGKVRLYEVLLTPGERKTLVAAAEQMEVRGGRELANELHKGKTSEHYEVYSEETASFVSEWGPTRVRVWLSPDAMNAARDLFNATTEGKVLGKRYNTYANRWNLTIPKMMAAGRLRFKDVASVDRRSGETETGTLQSLLMTVAQWRNRGEREISPYRCVGQGHDGCIMPGGCGEVFDHFGLAEAMKKYEREGVEILARLAALPEIRRLADADRSESE